MQCSPMFCFGAARFFFQFAELDLKEGDEIEGKQLMHRYSPISCRKDSSCAVYWPGRRGRQALKHELLVL